jgi:uncharacterized protein GlcG (DUF336 family)
MSKPFIALTLAALFVTPAQAEDNLSVSVKRLTMESALRVAQATLQHCRDKGIQIGVTVVDRGGHPQVILRDTVAPDLTLTISRQKAYTALSFMATTSSLEDRFKSPFAVGKVEGLVMSAGGVPIEAGGIFYGAVGVSGAPEGATDEECALAGVEAIKADLEMGGF